MNKAVDYSASQEEIVRNVHRYLTEHLSERITIEELSRKFLMNATTLKNVFKQVYGTTIAAHMRMHRLEQAAQLVGIRLIDHVIIGDHRYISFREQELISGKQEE